MYSHVRLKYDHMLGGGGDDGEGWKGGYDSPEKGKSGEGGGVSLSIRTRGRELVLFFDVPQPLSTRLVFEAEEKRAVVIHGVDLTLLAGCSRALNTHTPCCNEGQPAP